MRKLETTKTRSIRRGSALVMALIAVFTVSALAAGLLSLSSSLTRKQGSASDTKQAFYLAEAGLAEAYTGLAVARTGNVASAAAPAVLGDGMFWVEATRTGDLVELESTGLYGAGRVTLGLVAEPVELLISKLGFHTSDSIMVNPDTVIDSFDSAQGTYASQVGTPLNNMAVLGSNNDIDLNPGVVVYGDVMPGPAGSANIGTAVVTGTVAPAAATQTLPPIAVPAIPLAPGIAHSGATPLVLAPGELGYQSLSVGMGSKMIVKGPMTLVVEDLTVALNGELCFDTSLGPVDVFVTGDLDLQARSLVSVSSEETSEVVVQVASPSSKAVFFGSNATFYGFIYAPNADVRMAAEFEVYGGVVAKSLNLAAQGRLHYDLSLDPSREGILPKLYSWRVVDIPDSVRASRRDPFRALSVDRNVLPLPSSAHEDQLLDIKYTSVDGAVVTYSGLESQFDWSDVKDVLSATRDGALFMPPDEVVKRELGDDPLLDLVDSSMSSKELKTELIAKAPCSSEVLAAAANRDPQMSSGDLKAVLFMNGPTASLPTLADSVLLAAISSGAMSSGDTRAVLIDNSPLSSEVLQAATDSPNLSSGDLDKVLTNQ